MTEPLVIGPTEDKPQEPIIIGEPNDVVYLSRQDAAQRAWKAKFALPGLQIGVPNIQEELEQGLDNLVRERAAAHVDMQNKSLKYDLINKIARDKQGPLTPEEVFVVSKRVAELDKATDPSSVFEEYFSKELFKKFDDAYKSNPDSFLADANREIPEGVDFLKQQGSTLSAYSQFALTMLQNAKAAYDGQSWLGWGVDMAKTAIPFYQDIKTRNLVQGGSFLEGGLHGGNLVEQARRLRTLPFEEYKTQFATIIGKLSKDNPPLAVEFAQAVLGLSTSDEVLNNAITVIDASVIKPATLALGGKALLRKVGLFNQTGKLTKELVKAGIDPKLTSAMIDDALGNVKEAAIKQNVDDALAKQKGTFNAADNAIARLPQVFTKSIADLRQGPSDLISREFNNRLADEYEARASKIFGTIEDTATVERTPDLFESEAKLRELAEEVSKRYPGLNNSILQVSAPYKSDALSKNYSTDVYFGRTNGMLFGNEKDVRTFANQNGLLGGVVISEPTQRGAGYMLKLTVPVSETSPVVRSTLIQTNEAKTPYSLLNTFVGAFRTPEDTLSKHQLENRKIVSYAPSEHFKALNEMAKEINKLKSNVPFTDKKRKWNEFMRVVSASRAIRDADGNPTMFKHPVELSDFYQQTLHRAPDEQEIKAYFAYKQLEETLDLYRNIIAYRNKARVGAQTHTVYSFDESKQTAKTIPSVGVSFDGIPLREFPTGNDTILVIGKKLGEERVYDLKTMKARLRKYFDAEVRQGNWKLIRITNPEDRPFEGFGKVGIERVRYVLARNVDTRPLSWEQIRKIKRPSDYEYDHYVSQAKIKKDEITGFNWYEGDTTIAGVNLRAMGRDFVAKLNNVRQLIKDNKLDEARAANPFPNGFDEVYGWFQPGKTADGKVIPPKLSLNEPIHLTPRHKMVGDIDDIRSRYGDSFRDGTREGYGRMAEGEVDNHELFSIENVGSKANPLYNATPAKYIDPVTSINRALKKVVNEQYLNDYKIFSVEHWLQEARPLLDVTDNELSHNPYYYFYNPVWKAGDPVRRSNLETAAYQIKQLLGVQDKTTTFVHETAQRLADSIYTRGSERLALAAAHILPSLRDPFQFLRSVAFHDKLGLFNPVQIWVQMQTYAAITGIAGFKYAAPGAKAAMLAQWARVNANPEVLAKLDQLATKTLIPGTAGFKPGEWQEATNLLRKTGFANVAGEYAMRDNPASYDIITHEGKKFLNWGTTFFREGERMSRMGAFYTSYLEFRGANATGRITDKELRGILQRADLLSVNMSRVSNSALQQGVFSIPAQFVGYQLRLFELILGKRLTSIEKARLLTWNSMLYGIPATAGIFGLPTGDWARQYAFENGYNVGENYFLTAINEGLPSLLLGITTGNYYNIGERYGNPGGFNVVKDSLKSREALKSDESFLTTVGGASFSVFRDIIGSMDNFWRAVMSVGADDGEAFPTTPDDLYDVFKTIPVVNSLARVATAFNTGKWISRKDMYITDTSPWNAVFMSTFGLSPQEGSDAFTKLASMKFQTEQQQEALKGFIREYRKGIQIKDDPASSDVYFKRAFAILAASGYPIEDYPRAMAIAGKGYESFVDSVNWDFFFKHVNQKEKQNRIDTYTRMQQLKGNQ